MKSSFFTIFFLSTFICNLAFAQYYVNEYTGESQRSLYERKIVSYTKLKKTGWTLAGAGAVSTILGIVLIQNADWDTTTNSYGQQQSTSSDPAAFAGVLGITIGIPATITGIILGSIGNKKQKQYMYKLERLNFGYQRNDDFNSLRLTYRF